MALVVASLALLAGCAGSEPYRQAQTEGVIAWPPAPAPPRIEFVQEVRTQEDFGIKRGFWTRLRDMVMGEAPVGLLKPYGVHLDPAGRIYVVDTEQAALHIMDRGARTYKQVGGEGTGVFISPVGVTGDGRGTVYVTDAAAGKVIALSHPDYQPRPFGEAQLKRPTGIVFHPRDNLLYVSDTAMHQIVVLDRLGMEHGRMGERGSGPNEFNFPTDLALDRQGHLLVTDALNSRIQAFDKDFHLMYKVGKAGDKPGYLGRPKGVAVDGEGHLYVCDADKDMVQIFDRSGALLLTFGETGSGLGQFWMPSGIFIDADDVIYVADSYNRRVQIFRYLSEKRYKDDDELPEVLPSPPAEQGEAGKKP
jgi:DNA-binding beta-propeller fold protein YncE